MPPRYGPEPPRWEDPSRVPGSLIGRFGSIRMPRERIGGYDTGEPSDYPIDTTPIERVLRELLPPARLPDTPQVDPYGEFPGKYVEWQSNPPKFWFDMVEADPPVSQEYKDRFRQKWWWDRGNEGPAPLWDKPF